MTNFTKMHGLGNDFVVLKGPIKITKNQIKKYCDRHFGVGADGLLIVSSINKHNVEMKYWNTDGSPAEMCGNGLRCATRFAIDNKLVEPGSITVQTDAGSLKAIWDGERMQIETQVAKVTLSEDAVQLYGLRFYTANAGNPHAITFVDDTATYPVLSIGSKVEVC